MFIKILLTIIFLCITVAVGVYSRKQAKSVDGFVLGGRSVGPWLTAFAYGTSYFSAVVFVGYAGQFGWKYGLSASWIGVGNAIIGSLLAWLVLGRRTKLMTQHIQSRTMPDFFGTRYDDEWLRVVASIIAFVFLIPYTAGVYMGISKLFEMGFGIMALLTAVYVILGGYKATAINDFIQGIIMLFGITTVIAVVLNSQGGLVEAINKMGEAVPTAHDLEDKSGLFANFQAGDFASWFGPAPLSLLGVVVLTSLGTWGLPQMVGKFYAIKSEKNIKTGMIVSTVFAIVVSGGCYFLGGFGRLFSDKINLAKDGFDSIIPSMLATLPDLLIGIVIVLVLSASMSTLSSLVLTSSSTLTIDFLGSISKKSKEEKDEKKQVLLMRIFVLVFVVISVVIALNKNKIPNIAQLMGYSWGALAGAFLAPFMYGLYWKKVTKASVWVSFAFSVALTVANMIFGFIKSPINAGAITMLISLVLVPLVSLVTPKMDKKMTDELFECFEEKVEVPVKKALD